MKVFLKSVLVGAALATHGSEPVPTEPVPTEASVEIPKWNGVTPDNTCGMQFTTKTSMVNSTCTLSGSNIEHVFAGNGAFVVGKSAGDYIFTGYEKLSTNADVVVFFKQQYAADGQSMDNATCWDAQLNCQDNAAATGGVYFLENVNDHRTNGDTTYRLLIAGVSQGDVLAIQLQAADGTGFRAQNISAPFGQVLTNDGDGVSNDGAITVQVDERPFGQLFDFQVTRQAGEKNQIDLWASTVTN